ncbi:hypothetical protein U1Q18_051888, partial [Sarracenia purpurea var. burkii]
VNHHHQDLPKPTLHPIRIHESACTSHNASAANILSVCVKRKMPSDENLYELSRRPQSDYAPYPRWRTPYPPFVPHPHCPYRDQLYYMRQYAPYYFDWLPEEDEISRMVIFYFTST